jgi:dTDP-4-amino-4,6-dideoxygalactose transaminase
MRPRLPSMEALLPYLKRIDSSRHYTNFGPLQAELAEKLLAICPRADSSAYHPICVSSCTLGLELAITALDLPKGSRIGLPAFTFVATASVILRCGHVPVVFDVDPTDWMLKPETVAPFASELSAVIPVAVFGMPQDAKGWSRWSDQSGIPVIIDAAGGIGAQSLVENVTIVFSLHATKPIPAGEGGLVVTANAQVAARIKAMSDFGIGSIEPCLGTNAKLSEYHAAVGLASLETWTIQSQSRRTLYQLYKESLVAKCGTQVAFQANRGHVAPCIFPVLLPNSRVRDAVEAACKEQGIGTRRWYLPLIQQLPMCSEVQVAGSVENAYSIARGLLGLPFSIDLDSHAVEQVTSLLADFLAPL